MTQEKLHIHLFGTLQIQQAEAAPTVFRRTKAGALLAYLALHSGQAVSREKIADLFWPESSADALRNRLRQEISTLKRQVTETGITADVLLETDRDTLRLRSENVVLDVVRYQSLLDAASHSEDPSVIETCLTEAVALYRGPLLSDFDEIWVMSEREALANRHVAIVQKLGALRKARGDWEGAITLLRSLLALDPMHEEAHVDLMHLYAEMGKPTLVRQQYRELERVLREAFGDVPSEATRELADALFQQAGMTANQRVSMTLPATKTPAEGASNGKHPLSETSFPTLSALPSTNGATAKGYPSDRTLVSLPVSSLKMRPSLIVTPLLILACLTVAGFWGIHSRQAARLSPVWVAEYHAKTGEKENSEGKAIATDEEGNIYVCGFTKTDNEDVDILTMKFASNGKRLWENRYSSPEHDCDRAFSLVVYKDGVYVAGETYVPEKPGVKGGWRLITLKYSTEYGELQWSKRCPVITNNEGHRIRLAKDGRGGIYLAGTAQQDKDIPQILLNHYNSKGDLLWEHKLRTPTGSQFGDIASYGTEGVLVCGAQQSEPRSDNRDGLLVRLDFDGSELWHTSLIALDDNPGTDSAQRVTVAQDGSIYVAGIGATEDIAQAFWLAKLTPGGGKEWRRVCAIPDAALTINGLEACSGGDIALCGRILHTDATSEIATMLYSPTGQQHWGWQFGKQKQRSAGPIGLVALETGLVIAGTEYTPLSGVLSMGQSNFLLQAFNQQGADQGRSVFDNAAHNNDEISAITSYRDKATGRESLYVAGQIDALGNKPHIALLKYLP